MDKNLISLAIKEAGLGRLAQACGVTHQALRKWEKRGCLPRTEWTGETNYAAAVEIATDGKVTKSALLSHRPSRASACVVE